MGIFDKLKKKKDEGEVSGTEAVVEATIVEPAEAKTSKKPASKKAKKTEGETVAENKAPKTKTALQSQSNFVLLKTLVSEKSTVGEGRGIYTFIVSNKTNKLEVKKAVKEIYGVSPEKVRMINVQGKDVRFGYKQGRRSDWKKAIVTLPQGKTINIHEGV